MMKWSLYKRTDSGWAFVYEGPSGDHCKTVARETNRSEFSANLRGKFLIRTPAGNNWMKSVDTGSWRMKWVYAEGENL